MEASYSGPFAVSIQDHPLNLCLPLISHTPAIPNLLPGSLRVPDVKVGVVGGESGQVVIRKAE